MRTSLALLCGGVLALTGGMAQADGLFYQLPKDGTKVRYDMKFVGDRNGQERTMTGSLTMAVVGSATENGQPCRWIEFQMLLKDPDNNREQKVIAKVLIPEKHLKKGEDPMANRVRGWIKQRDRETEEITDRNMGPLPAFLAGPLKDAKKLDKEVVESKLGKLACEGETGQVSFPEGGGQARVTFRTRLHAKAPFGVVASEMKYQTERNGQTRDRGTITVKLADVGTDAKTELPDSQ